MDFAEATQEVEIHVDEPLDRHALHADLQPGRRRAAQHRLEVEEELRALGRQTTTAVDGRPTVRLFGDMPAINLAGPDDEATITRLRRHFEQQSALREQIIEEQCKKRAFCRFRHGRLYDWPPCAGEGLKRAMSSYVVDAESAHRALEESGSRDDAENARLTGENKALRREYQALSQRLKMYERDNQQRADDTERSRRHERALQTKIRTQDECMKKVRRALPP